jgi:hypothetical protein
MEYYGYTADDVRKDLYDIRREQKEELKKQEEQKK